MAEYEELGPMGREGAEAAFARGVPEDVSRALLRLALHDDDWRWVQERCLELSGHPDVWVRRNSATALGHIARIHGQLDTARAVPVLEGLKEDEEVAAWAEDALVFLRPGRSH